MNAYAKRELLHSALAIGLTVAVAVGAELADAQGFDRTFLTGLALTAVRAAGTAVVTVGSRYLVRSP